MPENITLPQAAVNPFVNPLQRAIDRYWNIYGPTVAASEFIYSDKVEDLTTKEKAKVESQIGKIVKIIGSKYNPDTSMYIGRIGIIEDMTSNASHFYVTSPGVFKKSVFYAKDVEFVDFKKYFPNKRLFITSDYLKFDKDTFKFLISPVKSETAFPVEFKSIINTVDAVNILAEIEILAKDDKKITAKVRELKDALCL